ncbi:glycosyltransferase family 9 protein [Emticicia sp. SJ17W-69]|uniref:glycosyltransferase family 9 protein n=1 Tax=Emticicia sp. SJ17W-69 TaxID=3421657 RepID=UPI003EB8EE19
MKFRKYCALRRVMYFLWLKDIFVDIYAQLIYKPRLKTLQTTSSTNLLFFNSGHLGDALMMSYCFPEIKKKYPNSVIDVVCGEWCKFIFEKNPNVRNVIIQNHYMTNRSDISVLKKIINHFKTARLATKKLKKETYDFSIDVRYSGAVSHWILPFIKVKKSYGFGTRGYGGLLEKEFFLPDNLFHSYNMTATLLNEINVKTNVSEAVVYLPFQSKNLEKTEIKVVNLANSVVVFPESGDEIKMFDYDFWIKFCQEILEKVSYDLLLCGEKGFTETLFGKLQQKLPNFKNRIFFTGKISLLEVAILPQMGIAAVTLDSFPAHLCSIFCKTLVLSKKAMGYEFFPINNKETLLFHDHLPSLQLSLDRKGFSAHYIEDLDLILNDKNKIAEMVKFLAN